MTVASSWYSLLSCRRSGRAFTTLIGLPRKVLLGCQAISELLVVLDLLEPVARLVGPRVEPLLEAFGDNRANHAFDGRIVQFVLRLPLKLRVLELDRDGCNKALLDHLGAKRVLVAVLGHTQLEGRVVRGTV